MQEHMLCCSTGCDEFSCLVCMTDQEHVPPPISAPTAAGLAWRRDVALASPAGNLRG